MMLYTRNGDGGLTDLATAERVSKTHPRIACVGELDELNAHLGLVHALLSALVQSEQGQAEALEAALQLDLDLLLEVQRLLFSLGVWAADYPAAADLPSGEQVARLEAAIDVATQHFGAGFRGFTLPGGPVEAAQVQVARTVCRRLERTLLGAGAAQWPQADGALAYINRLSDYLFALAQKICYLKHYDAIKWKEK